VQVGNPQTASQAFVDPLTDALCRAPKWLKSSSDARLYSRYKGITAALEEAGVVREPQETPEQYARRAARELNEPGMGRLGEIYLYARFRNAVPATLVEEFDRLEPQALAAIERKKEMQTVSR
jgi:hypothetical protein